MTMTAAQSLTDLARELRLDDDLQLLTAAGYLKTAVPSVDVVKLTDTLSELVGACGLPVALATAFVCHLCDCLRPGGFPAYAATFAQSYRAAAAAPAPPPPAPPAPPAPPPNPAPPPTPGQAAVPVTVYVDDPDDWVALQTRLAYSREAGRPCPDQLLGQILLRFGCPLAGQAPGLGEDGPNGVVADLVNGDSGPVLDVMLVRGAKVLASGPPARDLDTPVRVRYGGRDYDVSLRRTTG